jgi:hypothetical protein
MSLKRTQHWATREYNAHLLQHANAPFEWGVNDCCTFAANAIQAFTAVDIADQFRGRYHDEASAFALIKTVTGKGDDPKTAVADAVEYCANRHGLTEHTHPLLAKRGDLVVVRNGTNLLAGVVHLNGKHVVSTSPSGLVRLPITAVVRAWAV